jgi:16S rRNA (guanine966-N2)-methyltransferase
MRVIAGSHGGRIFEAPRGHKTHPMSEKMRGAIFGALGDISGLRILDAFAGSGALTIEALSRGAGFVQAIETDPAAFNVIIKNLANLQLEDNVKVTKAYAGAWSTRHQAQFFDIILLDPPYENIPWRDLNRMPRHLSKDGTLVLSWPGKIDWPPMNGLKPIQIKDYGDGQLIYYQ